MSRRALTDQQPAEPQQALPAGRPLRVAVLAFDRISPFHLAVPCVLFGDRHPGSPIFDLRVCAGEPGPLRTTAGFDVHTRHGLAALRWADWVIVPSWRDPAERPAEAVLKALVAAHKRGALVVGLCLGAFLLADDHDLDRMADGAAMSRRNFTRHFRKVTGTTPKQWLLSERLALAQRLLEATAEPVERIAQRVGFASATVLRLHMRKAFGLTPVAWRQGFSGTLHAGQAGHALDERLLPASGH